MNSIIRQRFNFDCEKSDRPHFVEHFVSTFLAGKLDMFEKFADLIFKLNVECRENCSH